MPATMSILGLYNADSSVLTPLLNALPDPSLSNPILTGLLAECAELEVVYSSPSVMKTILQAWASGRQPIWAKLWETTQYEYNAIHNYDRTETETIQRDKDSSEHSSASGSGHNSSTDSVSDTGTVSRSLSSNAHDPNITRTEKRYGFNNASMAVPVAVNLEEPGTSTRSDSETTTNNLLKGASHSGDDSASSTAQRTAEDAETVTRTLHNSGNIGVTTTQQMIESQRQVVKYSIVDDIINDFKSKFCLLVY